MGGNLDLFRNWTPTEGLLSSRQAAGGRVARGGEPCPPTPHAPVCEAWGSPSHWIPKLLLSIFSS